MIVVDWLLAITLIRYLDRSRPYLLRKRPYNDRRQKSLRLLQITSI
jgi:hypothetical protein